MGLQLLWLPEKTGREGQVQNLQILSDVILEVFIWKWETAILDVLKQISSYLNSPMRGHTFIFWKELLKTENLAHFRPKFTF